MRSILTTPLLAALLLHPVSAVAQTAPDQPRTITVTGEGTVTATPDMAVVNIGVSEEAETAAAAVEAMSAAMTRVIDRLESAGIEARDIQTGQLSLTQRYDDRSTSSDGAPAVTGFVAATAINVRLREIDAVGMVLDVVVQDGANRLGGVQFDLQDREPVLDQARQDAVASARARAELYATAAGLTLGPLLSLSEPGFQGGPQPMYAMEMSRGMDAPVAAGELSLSAQVTMVYEIAE